MRPLPCLALVVVLIAASLPARAQISVARDRQPATVARKGTASISGHVVNAETGRPLRLARVTATAPELTDGGRLAQTDENGAYQFPELVAGHYTISASRSGYVNVTYGQRRPGRAGRPVQVRDGQNVGDIDLRLPRGSALTGRVLDQDGEPVVRASVRALRWRLVQGERRTEPAGGATTDDRGVFRIYDLTPGTYFVSAIAQVADLNEMMRGRGGQFRAATGGDGSDPTRPTPQLTYAPTYYPGVGALSDAAPVVVGISEEVGGVDFTLQLVTAARVTGIVTGGNGPAGNAIVQLLPDDSRTADVSSFSAMARNGSFSIANVPPGRYVAFARSGRGEPGGFAVLPITVSGALVSDVNLALRPAPMIAGQVTCEGATMPGAQELGRMRIALSAPANAALPMAVGQETVAPRPDGSFVIADALGTNRRFRVSGVPAPWALKAIYLDGRDVTDEMFDLRSGETSGRVTILLTDKATALTGSVLDDHAQPRTEFTVIAFPVDANLWRPQSRFIQAARPDKDGQYAMRGLPPGEYFLRAIDDVDQGEWYDPELLDTLRTGAIRVMLQEGDAKTLNLKVASSQ